MFLRNFWYVAASDREVTRKPLGRMILGEPIVLFRQEDGTPVALGDRCVHRHLPLSMGPARRRSPAMPLSRPVL